jgi:phosphate transport system ATP-binding protein
VVLDCNISDLYYGSFRAVRDTAIPIKRNSITAFIGPSGCGKSTVLRCLNRMNDLVRGFRFEGHVQYRGRDIGEPAQVLTQQYVRGEFG